MYGPHLHTFARPHVHAPFPVIRALLSSRHRACWENSICLNFCNLTEEQDGRVDEGGGGGEASNFGIFIGDHRALGTLNMC